MSQDGLEQVSCDTSEFKVSPDKDGIRSTRDGGKGVHTEILSRADHVWESHEKGAPLYVSIGIVESSAYGEGKEQCADESTDKTLDRFLWTELDKGRSSKELACNVSPTLCEAMNSPQTYAMTSLQMTKEAGTKNQIKPSRMLLTMK